MYQAVFGQGLVAETNKALVQIGKFARLDDFYDWMYTWFGLSRHENPSLREVFATIAYCHVVNAVPELEERLPKHDTLMPNACYVFPEDWLRDEQGRQKVKPLLRELETSWGINYGFLKELLPETAAGRTTFPIADVVILEYLNEMLLHHPVTGLPLQEMNRTAPAGSLGTRQAAAL